MKIRTINVKAIKSNPYFELLSDKTLEEIESITNNKILKLKYNHISNTKLAPFLNAL